MNGVGWKGDNLTLSSLKAKGGEENNGGMDSLQGGGVVKGSWKDWDCESRVSWTTMVLIPAQNGEHLRRETTGGQNLPSLDAGDRIWDPQNINGVRI